MVEKEGEVKKFRLLADDLTVGYKRFSVNHVSFELVGGDVFGLIGQSGSGKSTIMKTLIGQLPIINGNLRMSVGQREINLSGLIGYSPQENALFDELTIKENIETFSRLRGVDSKVMQERMGVLLKRFDLVNAINRRVSKLSGGMKKRLDIVVAIMHRPRVLVLDEPFSGLDVAMQMFIWKLLMEFASEGNIVILSSHMLEDVGRYCSKVGLVYKNSFYNDEDIQEALESSDKDFMTYLAELFERNRNQEVNE